MRVLWIVNTIFNYPAKKMKLKPTVFGGWLNSLFNNLKNRKEIEKLAIATVYNGRELKKFEDGNVVYYLLPVNNINKYDKKLETMWYKVTKEFFPDVVHIHGTEYPHVSAFLNCNLNVKTCTSIQGLVSVCGVKDTYNAGINAKDMLKSITIRDILKKDLLFFQYRNFIKKGFFEKSTLQKTNIIIGRTSWDKAYAYKITKENKYELCNESLREVFYTNNWDINNINRHTIFVSQATYPIKGFHKVIEMLNIIKDEYPDILIYVAGPNIIKNDSIKEKLKMNGYSKYINKLVKKYKLQNNIKFVGLLNEQDMCNYLLKSHVFLQASSIENSPNSLGEAMLLGMPVVASYVGGTADMLLDKQEGLLYPFGDCAMMAKYIKDIFNDDKYALKLGKNAQMHARITHNIITNVNKTIEIYNKLQKEEE
ncbi:MAG: glycosyltransferase [Bacilli bacterium]|nr:glycosyltransferase [Bacilli bacterium]